MRPRRAALTLAASFSIVALVAVSAGAGAGGPGDWTTFHFDNARTGFTPFENHIKPSNVKFLSSKWVGMNMGGLVDFSSPVVSKGVVYIADSWNGQLWAFDSQCGSLGQSCDPIWRGHTGGNYGITSSPVVSGGVVYVPSADHLLYAFKAKGCGFSQCEPLWVGQMSAGVIDSSPVVDGGHVFVGTFDDRLFVFPAAGCGRHRCQADWIGVAPKLPPDRPRGLGSPAISNGVVYVNSASGRLYAFPEAGCGQPKCRPGWIGKTNTQIGTGGPAVTNGRVYMGVDQGLVAFDANGCGRASCQPLWTGTNGFDEFAFGTPAVWNGKVYIGIGDNLDVFDANGCGQPACGALFSIFVDGSQGEIDSSPAVANGVVFVGENSNKVFAGNANGCGKPQCRALWYGLTNDSIVNSSPAIVDGVLYIGSGDRNFPDDRAGRLYAFSIDGT